MNKFKGKTTHELAAELLALPNVPVVVELWGEMDGYEMVAKMTKYDPDKTAIICQKRVHNA